MRASASRAARRRRRSSAIIEHPDVQRMLLTMRALTGAARAICYATAGAIDRRMRGKSEAARKAAHERAALLTPVAKAFSTDIGIEVASLGVQVHGGMGYIEETGAAQHYRDARIAAIYEGTNGIQAIDLVTRKLPLGGGAAVAGYLDELRATVEAVQASQRSGFGATGARLGEAVDSLDRATTWLLAQKSTDAAVGTRRRDALSAAVRPRRRRLHAGGRGMAALRLADGERRRRAYGMARFFAENIAVQAAGLERAVTEGADSVTGAQAALAHRMSELVIVTRRRAGSHHADEPAGQEERAHACRCTTPWPTAIEGAGTEIRQLRCLLIAGAPHAFCAGNDIGEFLKMATGGGALGCAHPALPLCAGAQRDAAGRRGAGQRGRRRHHHAAALRLCGGRRAMRIFPRPSSTSAWCRKRLPA